MIKSLMYRAVHGINSGPDEQSVSSTMSPSIMVEGKLNPDYNRKRASFGSYVFVFNKTNNRMTSRSTPAIALLESNEEDGHYFISIDSGKRINSRKWTPLPITSEVIARVDELATSSKQDVLVYNLPTFEWSRGVSVADQIIPYEEEVPVHDEEADDPHVLIIDSPFEMVGMISDNDTDVFGQLTIKNETVIDIPIGIGVII